MKQQNTPSGATASVVSRSWHHLKRILCVRLDSIGDVLMTTPALRALTKLPGRPELTLLTSLAGASVGHMIPEIDEVWSEEVAWLKHTPMRSSPESDWQVIERIRDAQFDACVIFTVLTQNPLPSAMMCYLAGVPRRLAYCRENPYQLLTDWCPDTETIENARHEVVRQLDLVRHVGANTPDERLSLSLPDRASDDIEQMLTMLGFLPGRRWCVLHPGATAPSRRYPIASYAQVVELLVADGFQVVITGSDSESDLAQQLICDRRRVHALTGKLTVEQLAGLIGLAPLCITNNTGPAHIAAALGTPVIDLYALTNPQHTPWRVASRVLNVDVPCRHCLKSICPEGHHHCLSLVQPRDVYEAALELWHAQHVAVSH